jgi:hypothetical protein
LTTQPTDALAVSDRDTWFTSGRFAIILATFIFAAFPQVILGLETFVVRDYGFFAYPVAWFHRQCFWRGELPLWNPYNNCGLPFLAQWNTMPLYPPDLIYLLLPLTWSLSFFCLLHFFWAGFGMYFLAHRWTGNRIGSCLAGLLFAFNGLSLNLLMWPSHIATLSWMPWVVLAAERAWRRGGRAIILAAAAGAFQMLAGGPETILFTWLICGLLWLFELWRAEPNTAARAGTATSTNLSAEIVSRPAIAWRLPAVACLVAALAAAQLLPFLDLASHSQREAGYADARWSMPSWGLANFLVPMVFGSTWKQDLFFQYGQYWTSSYYLGVGGVLLVGLALWVARSRRVWLLASVTMAGLVLAGGDQNPMSKICRALLPQLSLMTYPIKFVILSIFAAPLLASFAMAKLLGVPQEKHQQFQRRILLLGAVLVVLIATILLLAWRWPFPLDDFRGTLLNGLSRIVLLALVLVTLLALPRIEQGRWRLILPIALLVLFWLDVWTQHNGLPQNPTVPPWIYTPNLARNELAMKPQPALGESRAMLSLAAETKFLQLALSDPKNNFIAKRLGYFADCNLLDGVPKVNGFFSLYPRECGELNSALYVSTNICPPQLADFLGVSQITAKDEYVKWQPRDTFLPLVSAGQRPVFLEDTNALAFLIGPSFDGRKFVFLPPEAKDLVSVNHETSARVLSQHFQRERVELEVEASEPSMVVLSQTYYHRWRAYLDGGAHPLLRANYAFQAIEVPAGKHRVVLAYEDRPFHLGASISSTALLFCLTAWFLRSPVPKDRRFLNRLSRSGGSPL